MNGHDHSSVLWDTRKIGYDDFEDEDHLWFSDDECLGALKSAEIVRDLFPKRTLPLVEHVVDKEAIKVWKRPLGDRTRVYQDSLAESAFYKNSLIVLPTGLGKTLIAIVVMYNYIRWFPESKIIFTTPTRPLVEQQMKAYIDMTGGSSTEIISITGLTPPSLRAKQWKQNRLFFLTPQIIYNDIISGICDARSISLIVFDEAHHATKDGYYSKTMRKMIELGCNFRTVGLTATPGSSTDAVQDVILNLLIQSVSLKSEKCSDIVPYLYKRQIIKISCEVSEYMTNYISVLNDIMNYYLDKLRVYGYFKNKSLSSINRYNLIKMLAHKKEYGARVGTSSRNKVTHSSSGKNDIDMSFLSKFPSALPHIYSLSVLIYARDIIETYGIGQCYEVLKKYENTKSNKKKETNEHPGSIHNDYRVVNIIRSMKRDLETHSCSVHPKTHKVCEVLTEFFKKGNDNNNHNNCALVFSQYRVSVNEICDALQVHYPIIRPSCFTGRSEGYRQKHQLKTLQDFKDGVYNVLVCTSVAEEGLDIGQVDMVVFYDLQLSAIRFIQRMGRTSRRRDGTVVFILSGRKSAYAFNQCVAKFEKIESHIKEEQGKKLVMPNHESCLKLPLVQGGIQCDNSLSSDESDTGCIKSYDSNPHNDIDIHADVSHLSPQESPEVEPLSETPNIPLRNPPSITIHPKLAAFLYTQKRQFSSSKDTNKFYTGKPYSVNGRKLSSVTSFVNLPPSYTFSNVHKWYPILSPRYDNLFSLTSNSALLRYTFCFLTKKM